MKYETAKAFLKNCESVNFLDALHQLDEIVDGIDIAIEDVFDIVLAYFDRSRNVELFSPETRRQIEFLQSHWGEDDVLWRCVERTWKTAVSGTCKWKYIESETYETECGLLWRFADGTPGDNGAVFCTHCGRRIEQGAEEE